MNQGGFAKVFNSILDSTIWAEDSDTRVVWVTMLVMSDQDGYVWAAVPGLAHRARVSLEACQTALEKLQAPDKFSRTPEHDGRRIEAVDGGWFILNRVKYRNMNWEEEKTARRRERNQRYRSKTKASQSVSGASQNVSVRHKTETETETYTEKEGKSETPPCEVPDLHPMQLARGMCEELGMPATTGNMTVISAAISALAVERRSPAQSVYSYLLFQAREARKHGDNVNKFWFEDARWKDGHGKSNKDRQTQESLTRIARELVAKDDSTA